MSNLLACQMKHALSLSPGHDIPFVGQARSWRLRNHGNRLRSRDSVPDLEKTRRAIIEMDLSFSMVLSLFFFR